MGMGGSLQLEEASLDRGFEGIVLPRQVRRVHRGHAVFAGTEGKAVALASAATRDETAAARVKFLFMANTIVSACAYARAIA